MKDSALEIHDLTVSYDKKPVLWCIDFEIPKGKIVGIIGPNGAGKSTLLKSIMGLIATDTGFVKIFNQPLKNVRKKISYVPQKESVDWDFPASVLDIVMMGLYSKMGLWKRPNKKDFQKAHDALAMVKMETLKNRHISELSGGQQQRVFLARALAQEADIYFLDEPFSGIDATTEKDIIALLRNLANQGKTIIAVHHDLQSVTSYFDWVVLLNLRLIDCGETSGVFTNEKLQKTYGGKLPLLSEVGQLMKKENVKANQK